MPNPPMLFSNQKTNLELLRTVGQVTYGTFWQKAMAKKLGMSQRQMIRWTNGEWEVPDVLQSGKLLTTALLEILDEHQKTVNAVRGRLISLSPPSGRTRT